MSAPDSLALAESALEHALLAVRAARSQQSEPTDELLDMDAALERFGIGRDGLLAAAERGEIQLTRGPRRKLLVSRMTLEAWLRSRPVSPRPRRKPAEVVSIEEWERQADRQLAGGRR